MRRDLIRTTAFVRAAKRLAKNRPAELEALRVTLERLQQDAFDPRLRTHKLTGNLAGAWACTVGYDCRIVFEFVEAEGRACILLLSVGKHDEVY